MMLNKQVFIIAEAGVNHNGRFENAIKLIDIAKEAGADVIKFQTFNPASMVTKEAETADYQKTATGSNINQYEMLKDLALSNEEFIALKKYCDQKEIQFLSTPFDNESIDFLNNHVSMWKIPSGEITNVPYLVKIAKTRKPVILSTGMSEIFEIDFAIEILKKYGTKDITLLHCNTEYPTPLKDVNLMAMLTIRNQFNLPVGYSDHTLGIEIALAAAALGATVIEKHITIDKKMEGPDHKVSLEPDELRQMIKMIRNIEISLGDGIKRTTDSEIKNKTIVRKSIVAKTAIKKGDILTEDNITVKRPGNGISPLLWFEVIGKPSKKDYIEDEQI